MLWVWWALNPLLVPGCIPLNLELSYHTWCRRGQFIDIFYDQPRVCRSQLHYEDTGLGQCHPNPLHMYIWFNIPSTLYHVIPMHRNEYHVASMHVIPYPRPTQPLHSCKHMPPNTRVYLLYVCRPMPNVPLTLNPSHAHHLSWISPTIPTLCTCSPPTFADLFLMLFVTCWRESLACNTLSLNFICLLGKNGRER